jgi:hypothetical protein
MSVRPPVQRDANGREIINGHVIENGIAFVSMAASAFINAVRRSSAYLDGLEHNGFRLSDMPALTRAEGRPTAPLAGVNAEGRALILRRRKIDGRIVWDYHRRTRRLTGETGPYRRAFVAAIKRYPYAAPEAVRAARATFKDALQRARGRDAAMTRARA